MHQPTAAAVRLIAHIKERRAGPAGPLRLADRPVPRVARDANHRQLPAGCAIHETRSSLEPRRKRAPACDPVALRDGLTPAQLTTLEAMEIFRWRLAFVRRPLFQAPIPVLFDKDETRHVVIREDGTLDEHPTLKLRG